MSDYATAAGPAIPVDIIRGNITGSSVKIIDSNGTELALDRTQSLVTIDIVHNQVHRGGYFHAEHVATINNNASLDILITPSQSLHFTAGIFAGGNCQVYFYEAPTASAGTTVPVYNMRRTSTAAAIFTAVHTPTVAAVGTTVLIPGRLIPGGGSPTTRVGGGVRTNTEWILKPSTPYLLRVTNISGAAIICDVAVEGYGTA